MLAIAVPEVGGPAVSARLFPSCPAAIAGLVIAIVVDPIKQLANRLFPHVGIEVLEAMPPTIADRDASTTPVFELLVVGVVTALKHALPSFVRLGFDAIAGVTVRCSSRNSDLSTQTAARMGKPTSDIALVSNAFGAAVAAKAPALAVNRFKGDQSPEPMARDINKFGHGAPPLQVARSSGGLAVTRWPVAHSSKGSG